MSGKKVLCLVIPTLQAGGMERVMSELAFYFCSHKDLEVHLILYGKKINIFYNLPEGLIIHKPVKIFNDHFRFISTIERLHFLRKAVNLIKPDSILSFGEYWNSFVLIALSGLNYPVYVSDRCRPDKNLGRFHSALRRFLYPRAKGVIAQTSIAKTLYEKQFKHSNIQTISNPIRIPDAAVSDSESENIVLTVSRLIKTKNHDKLIQIFARINKPGWKLVIVGDNALNQDLKSELLKIITDLGVSDKVILTGNQNNVEQYYRNCKIFAFASESEGFPNVIAEAQSFGLPVIAFDCIAGPSDMITDNENGFLIPLNNYDLFLKRMSFLMDNPQLRAEFGERGRHSIKRFSVETIGQQYYHFLFAIK